MGPYDGFPRRAAPSEPTAQFLIYSRHNPPEKSFVKSKGIIRPCLFNIELGCSDYHKPSKVRGTVSVRVPPQDLITKSVSSLRLMESLPIRKDIFLCLFKLNAVSAFRKISKPCFDGKCAMRDSNSRLLD